MQALYALGTGTSFRLLFFMMQHTTTMEPVIENASMSAPDKLFKVPGLVAVVTGAGSGIGRSIARALALNGAARVYLLGRRLDKLHETAVCPELTQAATKAMIPLQVDITSKDQLEAAAAYIAAETGFVHLVVANAGVLGPDPLCTGVANRSPQQLKEYIFKNWHMDEMLKPFETNVMGVFYSCIAFIDLLDKGNSDANRLPGITSQVIVNSSVTAYMKGLIGAGGVAYSSSKAAVNHMSKCLSAHFIPYQIRVNLLNLGIFPSKLKA